MNRFIIFVAMKRQRSDPCQVFDFFWTGINKLVISHYLGRYLALENFSCVPNKSMTLTPFAIGIAILVSKMKFSRMITPNAYNGFVQDFLGHFPLQISKMPRSIRTRSALKYIASMTIVFEKTPMKVSSTKLG